MPVPYNLSTRATFEALIDDIVGTPLSTTAIDTLAKLNAIVTDATLVDESHTHTGADITLDVKTKSANYTLTATDEVIIVDTDDVTLTLPTPIGISGTKYFIKSNDSKKLTVTTTTVTIDGQASIVLGRYDSITLISDGVEWFII